MGTVGFHGGPCAFQGGSRQSTSTSTKQHGQICVEVAKEAPKTAQPASAAPSNCAARPVRLRTPSRSIASAKLLAPSFCLSAQRRSPAADDVEPGCLPLPTTRFSSCCDSGRRKPGAAHVQPCRGRRANHAAASSAHHAGGQRVSPVDEGEEKVERRGGAGPPPLAVWSTIPSVFVT